MLNWQKTIKNSDKTWQDYYKILGKGEGYITYLVKNTDDLSNLTSKDLANANQAARNAASSMEEVQAATNRLATAFVNSINFLAKKHTLLAVGNS